MAGLRETEVMEDLEDQEMELARLQRQYRILEADRSSYVEEAGTVLRQQCAEIQMLTRECVELETNLGKIETEPNAKKDKAIVDELQTFLCTADEFKNVVAQENERISDLDREILDVEDQIRKQRKQMGGMFNSEAKYIATQKKIRVLENRLDKAMIEFNKQLGDNSKLRSEIDHMRLERSVFDSLMKKLTKELDETKQDMSEVIAESAHAYEQRDEARNKISSLEDRSAKDIVQYTAEMKDLTRILKHDDKLKDFMRLKLNERHDHRSEENIKRKERLDLANLTLAFNAQTKPGDNGKYYTIGDLKTMMNTLGIDELAKMLGLSGEDLKSHDHDNVTIELLEESFRKIFAATGTEAIDEIVDNFIIKENKNFALYDYVNDLENEVETMLERKRTMESDIQTFKDEEEQLIQQRADMMTEFEGSLSVSTVLLDSLDTQLRDASKVMDLLQVDVGAIFKKVGLDPKPVAEMLGGTKEITEKNIMLYLGMVEQRTNELVGIHHLVQHRALPPPPPVKNPNAQQAVVKPPAPPARPAITIVPPTTDDGELCGEDDDDEDVQPMSVGELKKRVMKCISKKEAALVRLANQKDTKKRKGQR